MFYIHSIEKLISWLSCNNYVIKKKQITLFGCNKACYTFQVQLIYTDKTSALKVFRSKGKNKLCLNY